MTDRHTCVWFGRHSPNQPFCKHIYVMNGARIYQHRLLWSVNDTVRYKTSGRGERYFERNTFAASRGSWHVGDDCLLCCEGCACLGPTVRETLTVVTNHRAWLQNAVLALLTRSLLLYHHTTECAFSPDISVLLTTDNLSSIQL